MISYAGCVFMLVPLLSPMCVRGSGDAVLHVSREDSRERLQLQVGHLVAGLSPVRGRSRRTAPRAPKRFSWRAAPPPFSRCALLFPGRRPAASGLIVESQCSPSVTAFIVQLNKLYVLAYLLSVMYF